VPASDDRDALQLFKAGSLIKLGDGNRASFWSDGWFPGGLSVQDMFPALSSYACKSEICVATAIQNRRWVRDISGGLSVQALAQYLQLWDLVETVTLVAELPDVAIWKGTKDGSFSVNSAYRLFFMAYTRFGCAKAIWKSKAPMKCKLFMWLAVHRRCLTADNLQQRGWPHNSTCLLCQVTAEDCDHLFVHCRFTCQVWNRIRSWSKADFPTPGNAYRNTEEWWLQARKRAPKNLRRDFDTVTILVHWRIWKERNARIFQQKFSPINRVFELIIEDLRAWKTKGCVADF
jgi:hypothetical protein